MKNMLTPSDVLCVITGILAVGAVVSVVLGVNVPPWYQQVLAGLAMAVAAIAVPKGQP
jgi:ribose/xylose/arabinose/galactoside ABC-type transport system permease subunit